MFTCSTHLADQIPGLSSLIILGPTLGLIPSLSQDLSGLPPVLRSSWIRGVVLQAELHHKIDGMRYPLEIHG